MDFRGFRGCLRPGRQTLDCQAVRRQRSITVTICGIARSGGYTAVPLAERLAVLDLVLRYFDKYWHNLKVFKELNIGFELCALLCDL